MAEYSEREQRVRRTGTVGAMLCAFGGLVSLAAIATFPRESGWGGVYAILGGIVLLVGVGMLLRQVVPGRGRRALCVARAPSRAL